MKLFVSLQFGFVIFFFWKKYIFARAARKIQVKLTLGLCRNERQTNNNGDSESDPGIVLGRDFSGTVVEVGLRVNTFKVGDGVWSALPLAVNGALCEYVVLPASQVI